jgi:hypothetical protein
MCFSSINLVEETPAARKSVLFFLGFYLADLSVKDCNVVTRAAGKLADLGDTRGASGASGGSLAGLDQPQQSLALRQLAEMLDGPR